MAATQVLGACVERRASSSLALGTQVLITNFKLRIFKIEFLRRISDAN